MQNLTEKQLLFRIRAVLIFFIAALVLSGLTAFPLRWELWALDRCLGYDTLFGDTFPRIAGWLEYINDGLIHNGRYYPFMAYGTDWLAFSHIVIAIAFIGPLRDPVRNVWVLQFGMIACALVFPLAVTCGYFRGIPLLWQGIDCSFGFFGFFPLWFAYRWTRILESLPH